MRIGSLQAFHQGVNAILDKQADVLKTQQQLSTGRRFASPADDPTAAARVLGLDESVALTQQYQRNIEHARARLELEDRVLGGATDVLQRARELTVQALNGTTSASDRQAIAKEVRQLRDQLLALGNTQDAEGEYIFAGSRVHTRPFAAATGGGYSYSGDQTERRLQISRSRQVAVDDSGFALFMKVKAPSGSGYQDAFTTLDQLASDLASGSVSGDSLTAIDNAMGNVLRVRARTGARLNVLDREGSLNESLLVGLKGTRSRLEDVDVVQAATRLNRQMLVLQAAQQAFVKTEGLSLFNFIR